MGVAVETGLDSPVLPLELAFLSQLQLGTVQAVTWHTLSTDCRLNIVRAENELKKSRQYQLRVSASIDMAEGAGFNENDRLKPQTADHKQECLPALNQDYGNGDCNSQDKGHLCAASKDDGNDTGENWDDDAYDEDNWKSSVDVGENCDLQAGDAAVNLNPPAVHAEENWDLPAESENAGENFNPPALNAEENGVPPVAGAEENWDQPATNANKILDPPVADNGDNWNPPVLDAEAFDAGENWDSNSDDGGIWDPQDGGIWDPHDGENWDLPTAYVEESYVRAHATPVFYTEVDPLRTFRGMPLGPEQMPMEEKCEEEPKPKPKKKEKPKPNMVPGNPKRIFVNNLDYRCNEKEVKEFFRRFGPVNNCHIPKINSRSKGQAFVTFAKAESAEAALNLSEVLILRDRQLHIEKALTRPKASLNVKRPTDTTNNNASDKTDKTIPDTDTYDESKPCLIDRLSNDCLLHVFSFLGMNESLQAERVCTRWRDVGLRLWGSRRELHVPLDLTQPALPMSRAGDYHLGTLLRRCENLHVLSIEGMNLTDWTLCNVGRHCKNLKSLNMMNMNVSNGGLRELACLLSQLEEIKLSGCSVGEKSLWYLFKNNRNLQKVNLHTNTKLTGQCFHVMSPALTHIELEFCNKLGDVGLKKLGACVNLEYLNLKGCSSVTEDGLQHLETCTKLRFLDLSLILNRHTVGTLKLSFLEKLEELETLNLGRCSSVSDDTLLSLHNCKKIKHLYLSHLKKLSDGGISRLRHLVQLEKLDVTGVGDLTDACVPHLRRFTRLHTLLLRSCGNNMGAAIPQTIPHWRGLRVLDVTACYDVDVRALLLAASTHCQAYDTPLTLHLTVTTNNQELLDLVRDCPLLDVIYQLEVADSFPLFLEEDFIARYNDAIVGFGALVDQGPHFQPVDDGVYVGDIDFEPEVLDDDFEIEDAMERFQEEWFL